MVSFKYTDENISYNKKRGKMKSSQKSQITMLMIIGLVLFIIVSFVFYLSKSSISKKSQTNIKRTQETALDTRAIKDLVAKCLDKLAKDAIILLGRQGGYIYASQGGTLVDYRETDEGSFFVRYNNFNVAYNILPPRFAAPPYSSDAPDYPWQTFPYETAESNAEIFDGFFGISNMPPLNSSEGSHSIQSQIEKYIDNNMAKCADLTIFQNQGYNIVMNSTLTSVVIGTRHVAVKAKVPITLSNPIMQEFSEINDFSTDIDFKLRETYYFAKGLIGKDINDINFSLSDPKNNRNSLKVQVIKHFFSNDDLVIITNQDSLISGKPFGYVFARKNRAPALFYLRNHEYSFEPGYLINQTDLLKDEELRAEDPDEDSVAFNFYDGELSKIPITFPVELDRDKIKFKVEVSDGQLSDYQIITVNRI